MSGKNAFFSEIRQRFRFMVILPHTVCPRSLDPFHIVTYYIRWVKTNSRFSAVKDVEVGNPVDQF